MYLPCYYAHCLFVVPEGDIILFVKTFTKSKENEPIAENNDAFDEDEQLQLRERLLLIKNQSADKIEEIFPKFFDFDSTFTVKLDLRRSNTTIFLIYQTSLSSELK